jgi:hypothetical protein
MWGFVIHIIIIIIIINLFLTDLYFHSHKRFYP